MTTPPPHQPAGALPGEPAYDQPVIPHQAGHGAPPLHGYATPPQAGYAAPAQHGYGAPPQAGYGPYSQHQHPPGFGYAPPPPPLAPTGQRLAEFSDRLVARIIDTAILGGVTLVLVLPLYVIALVTMFSEMETVTRIDNEAVPTAPPPQEFFGFFAQLMGLVVAILLLSLLLAYLYDAELMFRSGQTVGKRIMKIRVIPLDPGQTLTRGMAFKRFLVQHAAVMFVPFLQWIDGLWQLWDKPYRQCLHDKFATTAVIKLGPGA